MDNNLSALYEPRLKNGIKPFVLSSLPMCGAKTRKGEPCKRYANKHSGRCRLHGGKSTGPKGDTSNANNANFKTGNHTKEAIEQRREVAALIKQSKSFMARV